MEFRGAEPAEPEQACLQPVVSDIPQAQLELHVHNMPPAAHPGPQPDGLAVCGATEPVPAPEVTGSQQGLRAPAPGSPKVLNGRPPPAEASDASGVSQQAHSSDALPVPSSPVVSAHQTPIKLVSMSRHGLPGAVLTFQEGLELVKQHSLFTASSSKASWHVAQGFASQELVAWMSQCPRSGLITLHPFCNPAARQSSLLQPHLCFGVTTILLPAHRATSYHGRNLNSLFSGIGTRAL